MWKNSLELGTGHIYNLCKLPHSWLPLTEFCPVWPGYKVKDWRNEFVNVISTLQEKLSRTKDPIQSMLMSKIIRAKSVIQDKRVLFALFW